MRQNKDSKLTSCRKEYIEKRAFSPKIETGGLLFSKKPYLFCQSHFSADILILNHSKEHYIFNPPSHLYLD